MKSYRHRGQCVSILTCKSSSPSICTPFSKRKRSAAAAFMSYFVFRATTKSWLQDQLTLVLAKSNNDSPRGTYLEMVPESTVCQLRDIASSASVVSVETSQGLKEVFRGTLGLVARQVPPRAPISCLHQQPNTSLKHCFVNQQV